MNERKRRIPVHQWSVHYFRKEEKALSERRTMPTDAPTLKAGDRVSFDLGAGVDGPPYAMNVRLLGDDD